MEEKKTSFFRSSAGVFQGGGCRAAAFVGAYAEAIRRGVSFTEVAGTSAGSIIAALVGAGAVPEELEKAINELDFNSFLRKTDAQARRGFIGTLLELYYPQFASLLFDQGFYSSSLIVEWVDKQLNRLLPNVPHPVTFNSLPVPTYIVSTDLVRSEPKIWSQVETPNELVAKAVQSSCAIPIFFQPVDKRYVDGGVLSNLPAFVFADRENTDRPLSTRVLAFSLKADEEPQGNWNAVYFLKLLVNAVVDRSQKLQLSQQRTVHVISIPTGDIKATDFERMTPTLTHKLIKSGVDAAQAFFDEELIRVRPAEMPESICHGVEEIYTHVTDGLDIQLNRVVIAEDNTDWVYSLFPTLLCWRMRDVKIEVLLPQYGDKPGDGYYRRKLLRSLGVKVTEVPGTSSASIRAYILDTVDAGLAKAIVGVRKGYATHDIEAVVYSGLLDAAAIETLLMRIDEQAGDVQIEATAPPSIASGWQDDLLSSLKSVGQYAKLGVDLAVENVPLDQLISLTRYVREYKYKQIKHLISAYTKNEIPLFVPSAVKFSNGKRSLLTPPVVAGESHMT